MHGTILTLLKRYVQTQFDQSTWVKLVEISGFDKVAFDHKAVYPGEHIYALMGHAAEMTGLSADELHEKFGEYLVPDLMYMYQRLLRAEWKTLDMLEHTELSMHKQVWKEHAENSPPVPAVSRLGPNELLIDYVSPRRMSGLAVGIGPGGLLLRGRTHRRDAHDRRGRRKGAHSSAPVLNRYIVNC